MVGIIIQSRMGSSRLPGKSLKEIKGNPLLYYSVARAKLSKYADRVVVATTTNDEDNSIEQWCKSYGIECFRGSEEDVLDRYYQTALKYGFEVIVRVTADDPFIDPQIIDLLITNLLVYKKDYITMRNKTNTWPYGLDVEAFTFEALKKAWEESEKKHHREHVTTYIKDNIELFRILEIPLDRDLADIRLTVDYQEDFDRAEILLDKLINQKGINFSWQDAADLYNRKV